jgi:hypothetical protein
LAVDKPGVDAVETAPREVTDDRWSALDALKNTEPDH